MRARPWRLLVTALLCTAFVVAGVFLFKIAGATWSKGDVFYSYRRPPWHIGYANHPVIFTLLCMRVALFGAAFFSVGAASWSTLIHRFLVLGRAFFVGDYRLPTLLARAYFATLMLLASACVLGLGLFVAISVVKSWS